MNEKIIKYWWIILILIIASSIFYWYQYRPAQIRKDCMIKTNQRGFTGLGVSKTQAQIDNDYTNCLRRNGLER